MRKQIARGSGCSLRSLTVVLGNELSWRTVGEPDLPAVQRLARECLSADGGQPFAANVGYLSQCYLGSAQTLGGFSAGALICISSLRGAAAGQGTSDAITTGLVHPEWRRRGIGGCAFDWARDRASGAGLVAESEAVSDGAHALYLSKGLRQVLAEDVMQLAATAQLPPAHPPEGLTLLEWGEADASRFYRVYDAAFRDRPGFPGWSQARWVKWISDDEDFRSDWTLLATLGSVDVGFIAGEATGWIAQLGVVPSARGRDIGSCLICEAVQRMRSAGELTVTLNVNINNPPAAALYRRLGFVRIGGRARYRSDQA
jgi:mycothiol synthase